MDLYYFGLYLQSTREIKQMKCEIKLLFMGIMMKILHQYKGEAKDVTGSIFSIDKIMKKWKY